MMECRQVIELLPWFANGSLAAEEADSIARHLDGCEACQGELGETGEAFAVFDQHLPAATLVGLAFDGATDPVARTAAESHLESCSSCQEQLALVRHSRQALSESEAQEAAGAGGRVASFPVAGREVSATPWRGLALAASITAMVTTAGWLWTWQRAAGPELTAAAYRGGSAPLGAGGEADRGVSTATPELNVPVVRAEPRGVVSGGEEIVSRVPISSGVVLVLSSRLVGDAPLACRLEAPDGSEVWTREGLEPRPEGGFTLRFSTDRLGSGRYTLRLFTEEGVELESYLLSIG